MNSLEKLEATKRLKAFGPHRVLINAEPHAVPPKRAARLGHVYDVVFIRHDSWMLGVPRNLKEVAEAIWDGYWVAMYDVLSEEFTDLEPHKVEKEIE